VVVTVQVALIGVSDLSSTDMCHVERWLLIEILRRTVVVPHKMVVVHRNSMKDSGNSTKDKGIPRRIVVVPHKTVVVYRNSMKDSGNSMKNRVVL